MSGNSGKRPPLVADRRYAAPADRGSGKGGNGGKRNSKARSGGGKGGNGGRKTRRSPRRQPARRGNVLTRAIGWLLRLIWRLTWRLTAVVALILAMATFYYEVQLPPAKTLLDGRSRGSVTLLDDQGEKFAWRGQTFDSISADNVSPYLRDAVIATEDRRFYHHFGVSPRGIIGAMIINIRAGRGPFEGHGGSTITQQVAKLLCLGKPYDPKAWKNESAYVADCRRSTLWRKIQEVPYALAMEWKYTKDQILTIYLNRAYLGAGARGFEAASERYFGKSARNVTPAEAAMLAGLLKAPSYYAPTNNLARARERANVIIGLMQEQGYLTLAQAEKARQNPAKLSQAAASRAGGYFADWVMESGPDFLTTQTTEDVIIKTTLDQRIQKAAEQALQDVFSKKLKDGSKAQAAIVVMSADGAVRAMVGGRKTDVAGAFNRATQALRQTGSAFKPFVYAAALDLGYSPSDFVKDTPLTIDIPGSGPWSPQNYERTFSGLVTLTTALKESLNVPAVRVAMAVGLDKVRKVASDFGIQSDLAKGPALALGVSETTLLDMTGAYAGILNGGSSVKPYGMVSLRLKGDDKPLIGQSGGIGERVISTKSAKLLTYMMTQVVESGTGRHAKLKDHQAAGKTGTSQNSRDAWFIGFTADYVAGVWMGNDDNSPMSHVTGGSIPAEIWHELMSKIEEGQPSKPLPIIVPEPRVPPKGAETEAALAAGKEPPKQQGVAEKILSDVLHRLGGGRN
ncbi:transglycosylase domain-containing protein [Acidimangrovimonas pyrenivorans]|uniref:peptidoglycan glycosyltransferase n=1 Tax=Acidimangrovimonas pyrenivorans TaxID=2030798 RepID=A0ABV7AM34_9RHOB